MLDTDILMSSAKKSKPTRANPRGKVTMGHTTDGYVHVFGFMDSALVLFISTYQGYSANAPVYRNLPSGGQSYLASADIHWYNTNMNAMDALDQCRTGNYNIERSRSNKWRDVFIMGLFSRTLKQSYLMYRFFHRDELSKRSHAVFHYKLRQLSFSIQSDNKAMHAKLPSKPLQAIRNCEPSSTPSVPTGHYHSMQK
jgi:hypothetical protein